MAKAKHLSLAQRAALAKEGLKDTRSYAQIRLENSTEEEIIQRGDQALAERALETQQIERRKKIDEYKIKQDKDPLLRRIDNEGVEEDENAYKARLKTIADGGTGLANLKDIGAKIGSTTQKLTQGLATGVFDLTSGLVGGVADIVEHNSDREGESEKWAEALRNVEGGADYARDNINRSFDALYDNDFSKGMTEYEDKKSAAADLLAVMDQGYGDPNETLLQGAARWGKGELAGGLNRISDAIGTEIIEEAVYGLGGAALGKSPTSKVAMAFGLEAMVDTTSSFNDFEKQLKQERALGQNNFTDEEIRTKSRINAGVTLGGTLAEAVLPGGKRIEEIVTGTLGSTVAGAGKNVLKTMGTEGGIEMLQTGAETVTGNILRNKSIDDNLGYALAQAGVVGAAAGGTFETGAQAVDTFNLHNLQSSIGRAETDSLLTASTTAPEAPGDVQRTTSAPTTAEAAGPTGALTEEAVHAKADQAYEAAIQAAPTPEDAQELIDSREALKAEYSDWVAKGDTTMSPELEELYQTVNLSQNAETIAGPLTGKALDTAVFDIRRGVEKTDTDMIHQRLNAETRPEVLESYIERANITMNDDRYADNLSVQDAIRNEIETATNRLNTLKAAQTKETPKETPTPAPKEDPNDPMSLFSTYRETRKVPEYVSNSEATSQAAWATKYMQERLIADGKPASLAGIKRAIQASLTPNSAGYEAAMQLYNSLDTEGKSLFNYAARMATHIQTNTTTPEPTPTKEVSKDSKKFKDLSWSKRIALARQLRDTTDPKEMQGILDAIAGGKISLRADEATDARGQIDVNTGEIIINVNEFIGEKQAANVANLKALQKGAKKAVGSKLWTSKEKRNHQLQRFYLANVATLVNSATAFTTIVRHEVRHANDLMNNVDMEALNDQMFAENNPLWMAMYHSTVNSMPRASRSTILLETHADYVTALSTMVSTPSLHPLIATLPENVAAPYLEVRDTLYDPSALLNWRQDLTDRNVLFSTKKTEEAVDLVALYRERKASNVKFKFEDRASYSNVPEQNNMLTALIMDANSSSARQVSLINKTLGKNTLSNDVPLTQYMQAFGDLVHDNDVAAVGQTGLPVYGVAVEGAKLVAGIIDAANKLAAELGGSTANSSTYDPDVSLSTNVNDEVMPRPKATAITLGELVNSAPEDSYWKSGDLKEAYKEFFNNMRILAERQLTPATLSKIRAEALKNLGELEAKALAKLENLSKDPRHLTDTYRKDKFQKTMEDAVKYRDLMNNLVNGKGPAATAANLETVFAYGRNRVTTTMEDRRVFALYAAYNLAKAIKALGPNPSIRQYENLASNVHFGTVQDSRTAWITENIVPITKGNTNQYISYKGSFINFENLLRVFAKKQGLDFNKLGESGITNLVSDMALQMYLETGESLRMAHRGDPKTGMSFLKVRTKNGKDSFLVAPQGTLDVVASAPFKARRIVAALNKYIYHLSEGKAPKDAYLTYDWEQLDSYSGTDVRSVVKAVVAISKYVEADYENDQEYIQSYVASTSFIDAMRRHREEGFSTQRQAQTIRAALAENDILLYDDDFKDLYEYFGKQARSNYNREDIYEEDSLALEEAGEDLDYLNDIDNEIDIDETISAKDAKELREEIAAKRAANLELIDTLDPYGTGLEDPYGVYVADSDLSAALNQSIMDEVIDETGNQDLTGDANEFWVNDIFSMLGNEELKSKVITPGNLVEKKGKTKGKAELGSKPDNPPNEVTVKNLPGKKKTHILRKGAKNDPISYKVDLDELLSSEELPPDDIITKALRPLTKKRLVLEQERSRLQDNLDTTSALTDLDLYVRGVYYDKLNEVEEQIELMDASIQKASLAYRRRSAGLRIADNTKGGFKEEFTQMQQALTLGTSIGMAWNPGGLHIRTIARKADGKQDASNFNNQVSKSLRVMDRAVRWDGNTYQLVSGADMKYHDTDKRVHKNSTEALTSGEIRVFLPETVWGRTRYDATDTPEAREARPTTMLTESEIQAKVDLWIAPIWHSVLTGKGLPIAPTSAASILKKAPYAQVLEDLNIAATEVTVKGANSDNLFGLNPDIKVLVFHKKGKDYNENIKIAGGIMTQGLSESGYDVTIKHPRITAEADLQSIWEVLRERTYLINKGWSNERAMHSILPTKASIEKFDRPIYENSDKLFSVRSRVNNGVANVVDVTTQLGTDAKNALTAIQSIEWSSLEDFAGSVDWVLPNAANYNKHVAARKVRERLTGFMTQRMASMNGKVAKFNQLIEAAGFTEQERMQFLAELTEIDKNAQLSPIANMQRRVLQRTWSAGRDAGKIQAIFNQAANLRSEVDATINLVANKLLGPYSYANAPANIKRSYDAIMLSKGKYIHRTYHKFSISSGRMWKKALEKTLLSIAKDPNASGAINNTEVSVESLAVAMAAIDQAYDEMEAFKGPQGVPIKMAWSDSDIEAGWHNWTPIQRRQEIAKSLLREFIHSDTEIVNDRTVNLQASSSGKGALKQKTLDGPENETLRRLLGEERDYGRAISETIEHQLTIMQRIALLANLKDQGLLVKAGEEPVGQAHEYVAVSSPFSTGYDNYRVHRNFKYVLSRPTTISGDFFEEFSIGIASKDSTRTLKAVGAKALNLTAIGAGLFKMWSVFTSPKLWTALAVGNLSYGAKSTATFQQWKDASSIVRLWQQNQAGAPIDSTDPLYEQYMFVMGSETIDSAVFSEMQTRAKDIDKRNATVLLNNKRNVGDRILGSGESIKDAMIAFWTMVEAGPKVAAALAYRSSMQAYYDAEGLGQVDPSVVGKAVRRDFPSAKDVPTLAKVTDSLSLTMFAGFVYQVLKTGTVGVVRNQMSAYKMWKDATTPEGKEAAAKFGARMFMGTIAQHAMIWSLIAVAKGIFGVPEDEMTEEEKAKYKAARNAFRPEESPESMVYVGLSDLGIPMFLNIAMTVNPMDIVYNLANRVSSKIGGDDRETYLSMMGDFIPKGWLGDVMFDGKTADDVTNRLTTSGFLKLLDTIEKNDGTDSDILGVQQILGLTEVDTAKRFDTERYVAGNLQGDKLKEEFDKLIASGDTYNESEMRNEMGGSVDRWKAMQATSIDRIIAAYRDSGMPKEAFINMMVERATPKAIKKSREEMSDILKLADNNGDAYIKARDDDVNASISAFFEKEVFTNAGNPTVGSSVAYKGGSQRRGDPAFTGSITRNIASMQSLLGKSQEPIEGGAMSINVSRVHDADTFYYQDANGNEETVRIQNVDAFELDQKLNDGSMNIGEEGAAYLRQLILNNDVDIVSYGKDKNGRTLARVYTKSGEDVGKILAGKGWVIATDINDDSDFNTTGEEQDAISPAWIKGIKDKQAK